MTIQTNTTEVLGRLEDLARRKPEAFQRGLIKAGLRLQRESQNLCPVDTGALKSSAYTRLVRAVPPPQTGFWNSVKRMVKKFAGKESPAPMAEVEVGYTMSYAIYVHEDPNAHHPVGQYKFLEQPARQLRPQLLQDVINEVERG